MDTTQDTTRATYSVVEDNGGGVHLYVLADETEARVLYAHYHYELVGDRNALASDLLALRRAGTLDGWEGNESDGQASWDALTVESHRNGGWREIADEDGIAPQSAMGAAGRWLLYGDDEHRLSPTIQEAIQQMPGYLRDLG